MLLFIFVSNSAGSDSQESEDLNLYADWSSEEDITDVDENSKQNSVASGSSTSVAGNNSIISKRDQMPIFYEILLQSDKRVDVLLLLIFLKGKRKKKVGCNNQDLGQRKPPPFEVNHQNHQLTVMKI